MRTPSHHLGKNLFLSLLAHIFCPICACQLALASALETFCGQAFGAGQLAAVGVHTQRAMVVLTLFCIPVAIFWWFMEPALLLMGQDVAIAEAAGENNRAERGCGVSENRTWQEKAAEREVVGGNDRAWVSPGTRELIIKMIFRGFG